MLYPARAGWRWSALCTIFITATMLATVWSFAQGTGQAPYTGSPLIVTATGTTVLEGEKFDVGGHNVAYYDTTAGNGFGYHFRDTDVDMEPAAVGGYYIANIEAGEWLEYTVNIQQAGTYTIEGRVASAGSGGTFRIHVGGSDKTGAIRVGNTGGWGAWQLVAKTGVQLSAGQQVVRFQADTAGLNLNDVRLTRTGEGTGTGTGSGTILREYWTGIGGAAVTDLTGNPAYQNAPSGTSQPTNFEAPTGFGDNYGTRMRGYVHPPTSGTYTFWIASDDTSELWLSTNDDPGTKRKIAQVSGAGWTNPQEFTKYAEQQSGGITLTGGQRYYIEALHKEGASGDNLSVAWQIPGGARQVIPGSYLSPATAGSTGGGQQPFLGQPFAVPGTIQAENFDNGVDGVACHDTGPTNQGGQYRPNQGVDIEQVSGGGYMIGYIAGGEWLEYTVNVAQAGSYKLEAKVASLGGGGSFHVMANGVNKTDVISVPNTGGWQTWQPVSRTVNLDAGQQVLQVYMDTPGFNFNSFELGSGPTTLAVQEPFFTDQPFPLPSTIEAEDFDRGDQGDAYNDEDTSNNGGQYRIGEGVDIENTTDVGGGYNVGWTATGEWLEYAVHVPGGAGSNNKYTIEARVASPSPGQLSVSFGSVNKTPGGIAFTGTGGHQTWQTVRRTDVELTAGSSVAMRVNVDTGGFNLNWIRIVAGTPQSGQTPYDVVIPVPGTIQAEDFDNGGEGVAFHEENAASQGGENRADAPAVDIEATSDTGGGTNIGFIQTGEWLEYTINVATAGIYTVEARVASGATSGDPRLRIEFDGVDKTGTMMTGYTGDYQAWQTIMRPGVQLNAGVQVMRVFAEAEGFNLNWVRIEPTETAPSIIGGPQPVYHRDCPAGQMRNGGGGCQPMEVVLQKVGKTVYWVDGPDNPYIDPDASIGNGMKDSPWQTIARATRVMNAGDAVIIRKGYYRERINPADGPVSGMAGDQITYAAYTGDEVVISGGVYKTAANGDFNGGWSADGTAYKRAWPSGLSAFDGANNESPFMEPPDPGGDPAYKRRRAMIIVDGQVLRPVGARSEVVNGTFYIDAADGTEVDSGAAQDIYMMTPDGSNPALHRIEIAARSLLYGIPIDTIPTCNTSKGKQAGGRRRVIGMTFRHAKAVGICTSSNDEFEENITEWNERQGFIVTGSNVKLSRNSVTNNSKSGLGGSSNSYAVLDYNESLRNDWKRFSDNWNGGGGKMSDTDNATVKHHTAAGNEGVGIWFDVDNVLGTIEQSVAYSNGFAGIMVEFDSNDFTVRNNIVYGNRQRTIGVGEAGRNSSDVGVGIYIQYSGGAKILHNTIYRNETSGLLVRWGNEINGRTGSPPRNNEHRVYNNLFIDNGWKYTPFGSIDQGVEVSIFSGEGTTRSAALDILRTNKFDGNFYWHPIVNGVNTSVFFAGPGCEYSPGCHTLTRYLSSNDADADGNQHNSPPESTPWQDIMSEDNGSGGRWEGDLGGRLTAVYNPTSTPSDNLITDRFQVTGWRLTSASAARGLAKMPRSSLGVAAVTNDARNESRPSSGADAGADEAP